MSNTGDRRHGAGAGEGSATPSGDRRPRVLMVLKRPHGLRGMQQQALRLAASLRDEGVSVRVIGHSHRSSREPGAWDASIPIDFVVSPSAVGFMAGLHRYLLKNRDQYDLVHVHGLGDELMVVLVASRVTGKPVCVKPSTAGPGTKLDRIAELAERLPPSQRVWRRISAWLAISEQTRRDILRLGVDPRRVHFIPNGVDTDLWSAPAADERRRMRTEFGLSDADRVFCTASQLTPRKKVDVLIRSFLAIAAERPNLHLWVIGKGDQYAELQRLALSHPAGNRVWLPGRLRPPEVLARFQTADAFALLSTYEGLPNALLEAMSCGIPAVVTGVSGMEDVVEPGVSGLQVPIDDVEATSAALRRLAEDDPMRQALGVAAARKMRESYGMTDIRGRVARLYRDLLPADRRK